MKLLRSLGPSLLISTIIVGSAAALSAHAQQAEPLPDTPVFVVEETAQTIQSFGCVPYTVPSAHPPRDILSQYTPVISSDTDGQTLYLCPPLIVEEHLTVQGQVLGLYSALAAYGNYLTWPMRTVGSAVGGAVGGAAGDVAQETVQTLLLLLAMLGNWLLHKLAWLAGLLLASNVFMRNPFVQAGWPFVLGVANLGFIIALLFIAFSTVMRWENFAVRRMLPRLLLGALLINFSLIIAAVLIDVSRIIMAIITRAVADGVSIETLPGTLLTRSPFFENAFDLLLGTRNCADGAGFIYVPLGDNGHVAQCPDAGILDSILGVMLLWGFTLAFLVLVVMLFVRYVALILLLIISPLPYLFIALPGAAGLAQKWWNNFLKYVFYGPAALFMLALVTVIADAKSDSSSPNPFFGVVIPDTLERIFQSIIIMVFVFAAALVGNYLGIAGAAATTGFIGSQGKRLARGTGRAAVGTAKVAGRPFYNQGRDFTKEVSGGLRKRLGFAERDKDGNLKKGQTSWGKARAERVTGGLGLDSRAGRATAQRATAMGNALTAARARGPAAVAGLMSNPALSSTQLSSAGYKQRLGHENVRSVAQHGDKAQLMSIVKDTGYIRSLNDPQRIELEMDINRNSGVSVSEREAVIEKLQDSINKAKEE